MSKVQLECRRGMLELDLIFERYLSQRYDALSPKEKELFSQLLSAEDPELYDWLIAEIPCPDKTLQPIVTDRIRFTKNLRRE